MPGIVKQVCNQSLHLGGRGRAGVQGHLRLQREFEVGLGCMRPCLKKTKIPTRNKIPYNRVKKTFLDYLLKCFPDVFSVQIEKRLYKTKTEWHHAYCFITCCYVAIYFEHLFIWINVSLVLWVGFPGKQTLETRDLCAGSLSGSA